MLFNAIFEVEKEYTIDPPATPPTSTQVGSPQLTDKILDFKDQVDERLGQTNDLRDQVNEFRNKSQKGGSWGSSKEILEDFQTGGWGLTDLLPF